MCKILKSVRFEARVLNVIEKQPGDNFSQKINSFIWRASLSDLKAKEKALNYEIKALKKYITALQTQLHKATKAVKELIGSLYWKYNS